MDPYKILGVAPTSVKTKRDLEPLRQRTKRKFKELMGRVPPARFDAKKLLEAFEMIKKKIQRPEGMDKILGRSRKEREMDKHFNHQTKEMKKEKKRMKKSRAERIHGGRVHLFNEKTDRIKRYQAAKKKLRVTAEQTDILQALQRVVSILPNGQKFPKALELLGKWVREHMNQDNREYVLDALQSVLRSGHHTGFDDCRQPVIGLFEYCFTYNKDWFAAAEDRQMLERCWRVAAVLHNECYTDDNFTLNAVILRMRENLKVLAEGPPPEEQTCSIAGPVVPPGPYSWEGRKKGEAQKKEEEEGEEDGPVCGPALPGPSPKPEKKDKTEIIKEEPSEHSSGIGPRRRREDPDSSKIPGCAPPPTMPKKEEAADSDKEGYFDDDDEGMAAFPGEEAFFPGDEPAGPSHPSSPSPSPHPLGDGAEEIISSDEEAGSDVDGEEDEDEDCSVVDVQVDEPEFVFPVPSAFDSFTSMQHHYLMCVGALMKQRKHKWARQRIEVFVQDVFYVREKCFLPDQLRMIEEWQAEIKTFTKERDVGTANTVDQTAKATYVDGRAEVLDFTAGADAWGAKQLHVSQGYVNG